MSLFVLAGALSEENDVLRARDLAAWTTTLPSLARPVRTDDLIVRFRMADARHGRPGETWYRLETHGTVMRCDAAGGDEEGRPVMPHAVSDEALAEIRRGLAACDALGVGTRESVTPNDPYPDDDSWLALYLQRKGPRGIENVIARWAYGPMAPEKRTPEMEHALATVYALYQLLMKIRGPADLR